MQKALLTQCQLVRRFLSQREQKALYLWPSRGQVESQLIPVSGQGHKDPEFKVIFSYRVNPRLDQETVSENQR